MRRTPFNEGRGGPGPYRVIDLYERPGCHLCEDMRENVERASKTVASKVRIHNVDENEELRAKYGEFVPVLVIDGEQFAQYRVDYDELVTALRGRGAGTSAPAPSQLD